MDPSDLHVDVRIDLLIVWGGGGKVAWGIPLCPSFRCPEIDCAQRPTTHSVGTNSKRKSSSTMRIQKVKTDSDPLYTHIKSMSNQDGPITALCLRPCAPLLANKKDQRCPVGLPAKRPCSKQILKSIHIIQNRNIVP